MSHRRTTAALVSMSLVAAACAGVSDGDQATGPVAEPPSTIGREPSTPPDVDLSMHSVPLEEVYFDTFDGGSVRLSDSTSELRARLLDAIPPIDNPVYRDSTAGDWLDPADLVLGFVTGGRAYAYPFKILNFHEIVNDVLDGIPVLISYCPLCRSAIVYDRRVDGETLSFGNTSALYESDLVMVDRSTGSYWWQVAGSAIVGPLTGAILDPLPSVVATWKSWEEGHPDTLILTRDTGFSRPYERDSFGSYAEYIDSGQFVFPVSETSQDGRLQPSALVVGVVLDGVIRAYPVDGLVDPINDDVAGSPIVVFPTDGGAAVFQAIVNDQTSVFEVRDGGLIDTATESVWTTGGMAVSGTLEGSVLVPVPSRTTFWFAFVAAFPEVELYQG
ncbi:MAG: DUF3179 domain-containing protein [Acidobacteria bacterium]|nr:DUF3179 domain-containing protein [Acidobacteriota bacterium]